MLELAAWSIVGGSFLLIGFLGYVSIDRNSGSSAIARCRPAFMVIGAIVASYVLNSIANQIFMTVQINTIKSLGGIREDQIQPDMPNLVANLIMFGWVFFLAGLLVALFRKRGDTYEKSEQDGAHQPATRPASKAEW